jgi:predicted nucleic acid-binding protein
MNVLVDTSVWSLALRRANGSDHPATLLLKRLVSEGRASLFGPVRQEILSGIKTRAQFLSLRNNLRAFPDIALTTEDYEEAARFFSLCRAKGIQGSNTDFLICATASRSDMPILTTDKDFTQFAKVLPISLYADFN